MARRSSASGRTTGKDEINYKSPLARKVAKVQSTKKKTEITNAFKASQQSKRKTSDGRTASSG
ncbi:hypothetical protein [Nitrospira sp. M1]